MAEARTLSTWAIIPARGGSKGVPRKNMAVLGGRPLVEWTVKAAAVAAIDRIFVSTEDREIAEVASSLGAEVSLRSSALAADDVHASQVVMDVLARESMTDGELPDVVMMLLPTAPFRRCEHIQQAISLLALNADADAVVGVRRLHWHRANFRVMQGRWMRPLVPILDPNVQRQESEEVFAVNGAMFAARSKAFLAARTFHLERVLPLIMDEISSTDIDTPDELERARQRAATLLCGEEEM